MTSRRVGLSLVLAACFGCSAALAQVTSHDPARVVNAARTSRPPVIDGRIADESWAAAQPATGFTQRDPDEGQPASERTELRILYDDEAVYIAVRMFDREPGLISQRLASRDGDADADTVQIYLDPMHDHRTGANFRVSASGVQRDAIVYNDTWEDSTWDGVWHSAVSVDEAGWSAEIRVPLSQLRFPAADRQTWGINVMRFIRRKNERAWLAMVPKNEDGMASRMAHLTGLDGLRPKRHLALLPYSAARAEFVQPSGGGNPFNDGTRVFGAIGLDLKYGVTSNLTLDGTINPDFGQVEVDPAVINLSAFETFFQEKRPFFLEGAQIFGNFGQGGSNNFWGFNTSDPNIFYSRRIGRAPQVSAAGEFTDVPPATTILGAAKLTGKTSNGWSIGLLNAVTGREEAPTVSAGRRTAAAVEPFTNYFVVRMQRDIGARAGTGLIATAVNRRLDTPALADALARDAYVIGGDGFLFLDGKRDWVVTGKLAGSHVRGTAAMVARAQRAPQRYFQRPDAPHVAFEADRSSLSGFSGRVNLNRNSGLVQVNAALWGVSPGFESNDLGFHGTGDRAGLHTVVSWRKVTPDRFTRSRSMWVAKWYTWNFNRELQGDGWNSNAFVTFLNYWSLGGGFNTNRAVDDDRLTRGGPSSILPGRYNWYGNGSSDSRAALSFSGGASYMRTTEGGWVKSANLSVNIKPSPTLTISTGPQWTGQSVIAQYIRSVDDPTAVATYGGRYVFGNLAQNQLTMTTRVNWILSPRVSVQVYAQPLLAVGDYRDFKELAQPGTFDFLHYGSPGTLLSYDAGIRTYTADPDAAGAAPPLTFRNPDFSVKSLRVNAVFRWELKPGSTFYAVWTRSQEDHSHPGDLDLRRDAAQLLTSPGDDVFLVKMAYWLGR